jgi:hypothetical protein
MNDDVETRAWVPAPIERWSLGLFMLVCASTFFYMAVLVVREPYMLNYTEGILLWAANQLAAGEGIYLDIDRAPFAYFAYGPVHPAICAPLVALFGPSLLPIRVLTVLSELVIVLFVYRILTAYAVTRWYAATGAALVMGALALQKFHALARIDMLVLAFEMWGLSELVAFRNDRRRIHLLWFVVAQVVALLSKPTAIVLLGGAGLLALSMLRHERRDGLRIVLGCAAAGVIYGLALLVGSLMTDGAFFEFQFTYQGASSFCNVLDEECKWVRVRAHVVQLHHGSFLLVALVSIVLVRKHGFLYLLFALSMGWWCFANLKRGADLNYIIEPLLLSGIVIGAALPHWRARAERIDHRLGALGVPLLGCISPASAWTSGAPIHDWICKEAVHPTPEAFRELVLEEGGNPDEHDPNATFDLLASTAQQERERIAELTRAATGILLVEEPAFAVQAGKEIWITDPWQMVALHREGMFDIEPVLDACRDGRIQWIFAGSRVRDLPGLREVIATSYDEVYRAEHAIESTFWVVYRHRQPSGAPATAEQEQAR